MTCLTAKPLSADAFSPYGDVIEAGTTTPLMINENTTRRFHDLAHIDVSMAGGHAILNIFRGEPRPQPFEIRMLEKHPLGSQAFIPLSGEPYFVLVAAPCEVPRMDRVECFIAQPWQGVNYARNVWHHPLLATGKVCDFLVVDRGGEGDNLVEYFFEPEDYRLLPNIDDQRS